MLLYAHVREAAADPSRRGSLESGSSVYAAERQPLLSGAVVTRGARSDDSRIAGRAAGGASGPVLLGEADGRFRRPAALHGASSARFAAVARDRPRYDGARLCRWRRQRARRAGEALLSSRPSRAAPRRRRRPSRRSRSSSTSQPGDAARSDAAGLGRAYATLLSPLLQPSEENLVAGLRLFEREEAVGAFDAVLAAAAIAAQADALRLRGSVVRLRSVACGG